LDNRNKDIEKLRNQIDAVKNRSDYLGPQGFREQELVDS
jgi:hypothetical protein